MANRLIKDVVARRTDLSTFLVHLTKQHGTSSARTSLGSILATRTIEARNPMGAALALLTSAADRDTQKCVCFTETPLEHVLLLCGPMDSVQGTPKSEAFEQYGIALTRKQGRKLGLNPVWYIDQSPTSIDFLTLNLNNIVSEQIAKGTFAASDIARLTPFYEVMQPAAAGMVFKEFWWEREWRYCGNRNKGFGPLPVHLRLPDHIIAIAPESDHASLLAVAAAGLAVSFVDAQWSLEQIIARLANIPVADIGPFW